MWATWKIIKNSTQERQWKGGEMKNEKYKKGFTTAINFLLLFCVYGKEHFAQRHCLGKGSLYYYILSKLFLVL